MTTSFHRLVSARRSLIAAIVMALTLLGTAATGAMADGADVEANLPPSSRADYRGTATAACEVLALYAGMSSNARSIALIEGNDPANCSTTNEAMAEFADAEVNLPPSSRADYHGTEPVVAGVQEAPAPEIPFDHPQTFPE